MIYILGMISNILCYTMFAAESSLSFERVCVMFNVGAALSAAAAAQGVGDDAALQGGARLLQQAAGVFDKLRSEVPVAVRQEPTPDLRPDTLAALSALMLAQAQDALVLKCVRDRAPPAVVARVAAHADDLYGAATRALDREPGRSLWDRDWPPAALARQLGLRALAHEQQAAVCRERREVGEEISRLRAAAELWRGSGGRALTGFEEHARRAAAQLAAAEKDNDFIYHERVPPADSLPLLERAPIARTLPPPARHHPTSPLLFQSLQPAALRAALAAAAAATSAAVTAEVDALRDGTRMLNGTLASLGLPACVESGAGSSPPAWLAERARAVREAGGPGELRRLCGELPELLRRNTELLDETERLLKEEATADSELRGRFGERWGRTPSAALTEGFRQNAAKYRQIIDNAVRADDIVQQKLRQHEAGFARLGGAECDVAAGLPAGGGAAGGGPRAQEAADELRALLREAEALKAERDATEAALKTAPHEPAGLRERLASEERPGPAVAAELAAAALDELRARARASLDAQERLTERLRAAHGRLEAARGPSGADDGRETALSALSAAHDAFHELRGNLTEGVKFYNDLTQLLVSFQNKVSDFCFARRTEKEELLKDLTQEAARTEHRPAPPPPAHHTLPYPERPQGMPQPYAAPPAGAPYFAPLPAGYNPYATLPYPATYATLPPHPGYLPYQYPTPQPGHPAPPAPPGYNPYPTQ